MDVRVANLYSAYGVYNTKNNQGVKKPERTDKAENFKDTLSMSLQAEDFQTVKKALADVPDVRAEKVDQIKTRIDAGAYVVNAREVAARILAGL